jgi:hypothetical protein
MIARASLLLLAAAAMVLAPSSARAQASEQAVKAAFLTKFPRYVEWPQQARSGPVNLCLLGSDPFGKLIDDAASGQAIDQRPFAVRRIVSADRTAGCHLVFVRGSSARATAELLAALNGKPVLTVTDSRDGNARGMIHFALRSGRVSFHIDDAQAARGSLAISSRLLGLAMSVVQRR